MAIPLPQQLHPCAPDPLAKAAIDAMATGLLLTALKGLTSLIGVPLILSSAPLRACV
jgi:hypothetical protein